MLYSNRGICKWVAAHLEHLNEQSSHLIERLNIVQADHFDAYHFLQAQRVIDNCYSVECSKTLQLIFSECDYVPKFANILDASLNTY